MSYDTPQKEVYNFPSTAFGNSTTALKFQGPPGKTGFVRDISVEISADMVGTTTVPEIVVGLLTSGNDYARFRLGTTAILGYTAANTPFRARTLAQNAALRTGVEPITLTDFAGHISLGTARLPADTAFFITGLAGTGGAPAGTARYEVTIDWF